MPMGVPAALLERRPDVRRTEDRGMAATANVGVAIANQLPKLSLDGVIGLAGSSLGSSFGADRLFQGTMSSEALGKKP